MDRKSIKTKI